MKYAQLGSVSEGTLRTEDLLDSFAYELHYQLKRQTTRFPRAKYRALIREANKSGAAESEFADDLVCELIDALGEFAPPYAYFGTHEGDGASFGYWPMDLEEFDGLRVNDTSEVPRDYSGEVLHVNDHGNATLYVARRGKLSEVWGIV
jgi:hypothetical protein